MAAKRIAYDQEAREAIRRGVAKLARAVKAFQHSGIRSLEFT